MGKRIPIYLKKQSVTSLKTGKVVEIAMKIKGNKNNLIVLKDFFHIAYGE